MKRRDFIGAIGAGAAAAWVPRSLAAVRKKPNLLFVFTDQQSFDMIGATNPQVRTPVLDDLVKSGLRFEHAVSNQPICTPYRGMLFSGQHPLYNGCVSNDIPLLPTSSDRFAHVLIRAGYETAYIGKWHLYGGGGPGRAQGVPPGPKRQGFDETFLSNNCHVDYRPEACHFYDDANERIFFKEVYPDRPWELEAQTRQVEEWFGRRDRTRPFACFVSWHPPHDYAGDGCSEMPGRQYCYNVDVLDTELIKPYEKTEIKLRPGMPLDPAMEECRRHQYRNYMAMITACDSALGRLIDQLKQQGVFEDTLIVFTSDHGDMLGSHGAEKPKQYPQDYSLRVPLVMHWSGQIPQGQTTDLLIGAMDMMPTILGLLGLPVPDSVQGKDLSLAVKANDGSFVESVPVFMFPAEGEWRGVCTKEWTYARGIAGHTKRDGVEINVLFNRKEDPGQLNNLFGDPACAAVQKKMEALTLEWMNRFNDKEYTWADFQQAQKTAGLKSWNKNEAHRPIDLLRQVR